MDLLSLLGIAIGLAMDAFAVSVASGAASRKIKVQHAALTAFSFGIFQSVMPVIGWLVGKAGESFIKSVDHWVALVLLSYLGGQMIFESRNKCKDPNECSTVRVKSLLALSVATSIDALATGIILPSAVGASTGLLMLYAVATIGIITFLLCFAGVYIGNKFGSKLTSKAEILGGIVLISIGVKILIDHLVSGT